MILIGGHSLGAARAMQIAFDRIKRGLPVDGIICAGCPRPGDHVLRDALADHGCPIVSLRNTHDAVTHVPWDTRLGNIGLEYVDAAPFVDVDVSYNPTLPDWGPALNGHHVQLYQQAAGQIMSPLPVAEAIDAVADLYKQMYGWHWLHQVDGQYYGAKRLSDGSMLLISRGSTMPLDFLDDFEVAQVTVHGAELHEGFWSGVAPVLAEIDKVLSA